MWARYYTSYWEVTMCQWQKRLDPMYDTYGSGLVNIQLCRAFAVFGRRREYGGVRDHRTLSPSTAHHRCGHHRMRSLPIDHHARAYARAVQAGREDDGHDSNNSNNNNNNNDNNSGKQPAYRLYEVQNGNHIENYKAFYPQLEYILPHAQRAFDLLVKSVEQRAPLPPDQCIPRGAQL